MEHAPHPVSTFEKIDRKSPEILAALMQAPIYRKRGTVKAHPAAPGERITTVLSDGRTETENTANEGDWIVTNPKGEQYIISGEKFLSRYEPTEEEGVYAANGLIRAIKNPYGKPIEIMASWGEPQSGDAKCYIADTCNEFGELSREPYLIDGAVFPETYGPKEPAT